MRRGGVVLMALALAGCATAARDMGSRNATELAKALDGRVAGAPQQCIDSARAEGPMIFGPTILYRDGSRLWRTDAVDGCPGLRDDMILVTEIYGGRLCANDRFRTIARGGAAIPGPYCRFGPFTPYTKP